MYTLKNNPKFFLLIAFVVLGFCLPMWMAKAYADAASFQIELIVFGQTGNTDETFGQTESRLAWPQELVELSTFAMAEKTLTTPYIALSARANYQPLFHAAWVQSFPADSWGSPVHIIDMHGRLNGYISLQRGQMLQLKADFEYQPGEADLSGKPVVYRLAENRVIKFNELHYFDHPKLGVVAKVTPL
ncbi:MAG: CsiV family protein [Methylococcaceae bacterium]|jgi:hypothetical protein